MARLFRLFGSTILLGWWLAGHAQVNPVLSIGTGFPTGVYHPLGNGMAAIISKHLPGYSAKVEATGGSVDNLKLIGTKRIDVGFSMADASWDAYNGADKFKSGKLPIRALMVLYPNSVHVLSLDRADINAVADLKGRRLATGAPGSATEVIALRVLEAYGIDKEIERERLSLEASVSALKDGKVDALFWSGGVPTTAISSLLATPGIKVKFIDHDSAVDSMTKKYGPLYAKHVIPVKAYPGLARPVRIVSVWNILVAAESMRENDAYGIVKTVFDRRSEMLAVHPEAENISLEHQRRDLSPIPFHPGALRYFAEKGLNPK